MPYNAAMLHLNQLLSLSKMVVDCYVTVNWTCKFYTNLGQRKGQRSKGNKYSAH